jgi:DNA-binding beta-propeller fold protein YncE
MSKLVVVCALAALAAVVACRPSPRPVPGPRPAAVPPTAPAPTPVPIDYLTSARIAPAGDGALVIDADSGMLVQTDRAGRATTQLAIGIGAGLLAYDPVREVAFVADRRGDRLVAVDTRAPMRITGEWKTPAEPFGVALSPDRETVLVTTIADRTLIALDARSGDERWRAAITREPRGIAVSPDGTRALVSSLATDGLDHVELAGAHRVTRIGYDNACETCASGEAFARGSGAVRFLDASRAVASFQRSVPIAFVDLERRQYGGGDDPPVTHHLAFLSFVDDGAPVQTQARIPQHQPRTLGWDDSRGALYVGGFGSDTMLILGGLSGKSTDEVAAGAYDFVIRASDRCGPDGIAVVPDGSALVWCAFTRTVLRLSTVDDRGGIAETPSLGEGPAVAASAMTDRQHAGMVLFNGTVPEINVDGALACATCHLDGRADGLTWKIGDLAVQTPVLAGRVDGTGPYKWAGTDRDLPGSLHTTVKRLGGSGLSASRTAALMAYLASLERPRPPTGDPEAIARGQIVFEGDGGCTTCHDGPAYTDQQVHHFAGSTLTGADTPSLIGLSASAPYFHDGSASTLDVLLHGWGGVDMIDTTHLLERQIRDLEAFLLSL